MFLIAHAFIVPMVPAMQARYYLHLVTPFIMLAGCGLIALPSLRWRIATITYLLFTPLLHSPIITDISYNEMQEFEFVRRTEPLIPDKCTVLEYDLRNKR